MMKTTEGKAADRALVVLGYSNPDEVSFDSLADLRELAHQADNALWRQAEVLRRRGESWQAIGDAMGITRQAVHKRLARMTETT